jgi:hypothetical protein
LNAAAQERNTLVHALAALRRETGISTKLLKKQHKSADAELDLHLPTGTSRMLVEVKQQVDRFDIPAAIKARARNQPWLLIAPYINPRIAARCRELHQPFADMSGNAFLEAPGTLIYVTGLPRIAETRALRFRADTAAGLRVTFALVNDPRLLAGTHRDIAAHARVALGTVGPVLADLAARGLIRLESPQRFLNPKKLVQEWARQFPRRLLGKLEARRFRSDAERLQKAELASYGAYWGGEVAGQRFTKYLKPATLTIYAEDPITRLVVNQRLKADPQGNLEIRRVFWHPERHPEFPDLVPPLLAYADLMATGDGRNEEVAEIIYEQRIQPVLIRA